MINTKYSGKVKEEDICAYCDRLIGKVFKLLPIRESSESTFIYQHRSLMYELVGGENLLLNGGYYIELINKLECLPDLIHEPFTKSEFSKKIKECIDVIENLREDLFCEVVSDGKN